MSKKNVYLDNAATTPLHPKVLEKMFPYLKEFYGNPSSQHSYGRKVRVAVEEARETLAAFINAKPGEIYFVSGGTEANNFILSGVAKTTFEETGKVNLVSTQTEHHCVLDTIKELSKSGFKINVLPVDSHGSLLTQTLAENINDNVSLVSAIHINNELGSVNNIKALSECAHSIGALFHSDAVQSFGKIKIDVKELGADALSFSSHKINGPKGIGAAYIKSGTPVQPLIFGGSQERNRRGGTENVPGIIGLAEAVKICSAEMNNNQQYIKQLNDYFRNGIAEIDNVGIIINTPANGLPNILSVGFRSSHYKNDSEAMLMYLDINGIAASNGSACTSGTIKPSHVILALGKSTEDAAGTIRFSFGTQNTIEELDYTLEILQKMHVKFSR